MRSESLLPARSTDHTGAYIHFPYCIHKCSYCDFYSVGMDRASGGVKSVGREQLAEYLAALRNEFAVRAGLFTQRTINTVFFGGGTASLMPAESVHEILTMLRQDFHIEQDAEITLEGNPENFSPEYIRALGDAGVNRIHVGIQSLRHATLKQLDRYFDEERYAVIGETLRTSAIVNRGVDLMYGVPGQTAEEFYEDLHILLAAGVTHVSLYSLTAEAGTPYDLAVKKKQEPPPNEDLQAEIFADLPGHLAGSGFVHYEVSNFGKPGRLSRHNLRYWLYEATLALGPGAHGFTGSNRYANVRSTVAWLADPGRSTLEKHDPALEIPLCILRILLPIPLSVFEDVLAGSPVEGAGDTGRAERRLPGVRGLMRAWVTAGYAHLDNDTFQWRLAGLTHLNDRIIEMQEVLAASPVG